MTVAHSEGGAVTAADHRPPVWDCQLRAHTESGPALSAALPSYRQQPHVHDVEARRCCQHAVPQEKLWAGHLSHAQITRALRTRADPSNMTSTHKAAPSHAASTPSALPRCRRSCGRGT